MLISDYHPTYINLCEQGDIVVVAFALNEFIEDDNIEIVGRELFHLTDQLDVKKVVLSLHNVMRVTSSVLGKLISLHRKLHRHEGRLIICNMNDEVTAVFRTSKLFEYFHIETDLETALAAID